LPQQVAPDGNAYDIVALQQPGNHAAHLAHRVHITLRWPLAPLAVYQYRSGAWHQLCYSNNASITSTTISCPASSLGIFAAVAPPSALHVSVPTTPLSNTRFAFLNRYLPLLAALALVLVTVVLVTIIGRPDKPKEQ
jgi:hypothetical protein